MQCCYYLSYQEKSNEFLNDLDKFTLIFSGLCHDVAHTGRTNLFEINSLSKLAIRYNDQSVFYSLIKAKNAKAIREPPHFN